MSGRASMPSADVVMRGSRDEPQMKFWSAMPIEASGVAQTWMMWFRNKEQERAGALTEQPRDANSDDHPNIRGPLRRLPSRSGSLVGCQDHSDQERS